jgi:hypothetical protein
VSVDLGDELGYEPRLPDPGRADDRHQPALTPVGACRQLVSQECELARPPDERRVPAAGEGIGTCDRLQHTPCLDGGALPLRSHRIERHEPRGVADEPLRDRADQNLAAAGRLLQALRGVDRVAGGECRRIVARHHFTGVDSDPDPELGYLARFERGIQPVHGPLHVERGPHGPQRVVLVCAREAEHGHHCVADELLHRAAVALDGDPHLLVPPAEELAQRLRVEALAEHGRVGQVAEEDADGLPRCGCGNHVRSLTPGVAGFQPGAGSRA